MAGNKFFTMINRDINFSEMGSYARSLKLKEDIANAFPDCVFSDGWELYGNNYIFTITVYTEEDFILLKLRFSDKNVEFTQS